MFLLLLLVVLPAVLEFENGSQEEELFFPQQLPWQMRHPRSNLTSSVTWALHRKRVEPESFLQEPTRMITPGKHGGHSAPSLSSIHSSKMSMNQSTCCKSSQNVTGPENSLQAKEMSSLELWSKPCVLWGRSSPVWGPRTLDQMSMVRLTSAYLVRVVGGDVETASYRRQPTPRQRQQGRRVGGSRQKTCFVCHLHYRRPCYSSFVCKFCGTCLCKDRRIMDPRRPQSCVHEHLTSTDVRIRCDGISGKKRAPKALKLWDRTPSDWVDPRG